MTCNDFLEGYTELRDGVASEPVRRAAEEHLRSCARCRRYERVMERGLQVLRGQGTPELSDDFRPRLRHRLYHVDDEAAIRSQVGSGATGFAVLGIALVLTAAAWAPLLQSPDPTVELSPIVVSRPPAPLGLRPVGRALSVTPASTARDADLWDDAHTLLFQYSPLSERYRQRATLRRPGFDEDH